MTPSRQADPNAVIAVIAAVACAATAAIVVDADAGLRTATAHPWGFATFAATALVLQLMAVDIYGRGAVSVSGIGLLAVGFTFSPVSAMQVALLAAVAHKLHRHVKPHRALYNAAVWSLAAGAGSGVFRLLAPAHASVVLLLLPALAAGIVYWATNIGLVTLAMSMSEQRPYRAIWQERFRWLTPHYVAFGPLALALVVAYRDVGPTGVFAFALPPALLMLAMHQYVVRTTTSVEQLRAANDELELRNQDLHELFQFAGGLAAQAHDRAGFVAYAQDALAQMTGTDVRIVLGFGEAGGHLLVAGGHPLGSVHVGESERWERLRDALLPQLATALESAELVERLRKTHLETIAALSRSMEAKDYYTGGHTERVATVAVALARRLGFQGADLDAVEIGALLHDIGKIGIPERILHKPAPLDDEEWKVMKEHPVISEYILAEVDLPPIVLQIARSSHERMDGAGYPDGLAGGEIPLAARIVLVADAFDALTSDRPYRRGRRVRAALAELREHTGTQFCPDVIAALEEVYLTEPHVLAGADLRAVEVA